MYRKLRVNAPQILFIFIIGILLPTITNGRKNISCGIRKSSINLLIVRGHNTKAKQWPWHATILHQTMNKPSEYACGGSLIHEKFVLTAKHCTVSVDTGYSLNSKVIKVQFGVQQVYQWNPELQEHSVLLVHTIENARFIGLKNDIALLELQTVVQFNNHVIPICLPEKEVMADDYGTVVGFGLTENGVLSTVLKKASMPVVDTGRCLRSDRTGYGGTLDEGLFCAGYQNGTTVCNGDSGGGLVFFRNSTWQLGGIVSFAIEHESIAGLCRPDSYGAFTKVFFYLDWIRGYLDSSVVSEGEGDGDNIIVETETKPSQSTQNDVYLTGCRGADAFRCGKTNVFICDINKCDGYRDCPNGADEDNCLRNVKDCTDDEFSCDQERYFQNQAVQQSS